MKKNSTPLKEVKNFGPVTLGEFESMSIVTLEQIKKIGWEKTCRLWVQYYPERLNANAFIGIITAIDGLPWTNATFEHKSKVRRLVAELRREYHMPPAKNNQRKRILPLK